MREEQARQGILLLHICHASNQEYAATEDIYVLLQRTHMHCYRGHIFSSILLACLLPLFLSHSDRRSAKASYFLIYFSLTEVARTRKKKKEVDAFGDCEGIYFFFLVRFFYFVCLLILLHMCPHTAELGRGNTRA